MPLLGAAFGPFWDALGRPWAPFGFLWAASGSPVPGEVASSKVPRIAIRSAFLELAAGTTGATGVPEVVSRTVAWSPPPTHAGGQDDGSYTNSLKIGE